MKGKKITELSPFDAIGSVLMGLQDTGKDRMAMTDKVGNITIDTCLPGDTNTWETGIERPDVEGKWVIVSQYDATEEAKDGHKKWVDLIKREPATELEDIDIYNIEEK